MTGTTTGPSVWRDLDQAALDRAYDQSAYAPNRQQLLDRYASGSARVRDRLGEPARHAYGTGANEAIDVFAPDAGNAPVVILIHGGAWRSGAARNYAFPAEMFVRAGIVHAAADFDLVQDHEGDLRPMAEQVTRAIRWVVANAKTLGGDPDRIFLAAHSSGAHLAAVALSRLFTGPDALPRDALSGALLASGLYDLAPVRLSARSSYVAITDEIERDLSPIRHVASIATPVIVADGSLDTPEFQRQSQEFADALAQCGLLAGRIHGEGYNQFELLETLANPLGLMGLAALDMIGAAFPHRRGAVPDSA